MTAEATPRQSEAPELRPADIQGELEKIFAKKRRAPLVALYGRGAEGVVTAAGRSFNVMPTRCELDLRSRMPPPQREYHPGSVFLVDWTQSLPMDLACRFARGRMLQISSEARLGGLFGAHAVDPDLRGRALTRVLLAGEVTGLPKVSGQRLTREDAYRRFLKARLGYSLEATLEPRHLVPWCARDAQGVDFVGQGLGDPESNWSKLVEEIREWISGVDPLSGVAWRAWEAGQGQRFVELCLLLEAALARGPDSFLEAHLSGKLGPLAASWGEALLEVAPALEDPAVLDAVVEELEAEAPELLRQITEQAEGLVEHAKAREELQGSVRLRAGLVARKARLAEALTTLASAPGIECLGEVTAAHDELLAHRLTPQEPERVRSLWEMAVRLGRYLTHRERAVPSPTSGAAYQEALDLAEQYAREGGFVDWARQRLRGESDGPLTPAFVAVLEAVDGLRAADDERFARGLVAWLEAGQPASQVLPISAVTKTLVRPILEGNPQRRLLVLLMDGMSWANAVQLVGSVVDEQDRWAPAAWRPKGFSGLAGGQLPPVLAAVPTLTQVSRAALFAGKMTPKQGHEGTDKDAKRWAENPHRRQATGDEEKAVLLLGQEILGEHQLLSTTARQALEDDEQRVVAMVLNTIDDQLKSGKQAFFMADTSSIKVLSELLAIAAFHGRAVLLVSDHGHVPGSHLASKGKAADGSARWRPVGDVERLADFEIRLPANKCWTPHGAAGVAAIWDDRVCYGTPHHGEHGGVSLAEVVAPAVLLAPETLAEATPGVVDEELRTQRLEEPIWWDLDASLEDKPAPAASAVAGGGSRRGSAKPAASRQQLGLAGIAPPAAPTAAAPEKTAKPGKPELVAKLEKAPVFKAHVKGLPPDRVQQALRIVALLLEAGGHLPDAQLAKACRVLPHRVSGLVARASEVLAIDGYAVVEHHLAAKQVRLDQEKLMQLYQVAS